MYFVYVLYSVKYRKIYIGFTKNLKQRLLSHNKLSKKGYTLRYRPWIVVFTEEYNLKTEAMKREKLLKTGKGREYIKRKLKESGLLSA